MCYRRENMKSDNIRPKSGREKFALQTFKIVSSLSKEARKTRNWGRPGNVRSSINAVTQTRDRNRPAVNVWT